MLFRSTLDPYHLRTDSTQTHPMPDHSPIPIPCPTNTEPTSTHPTLGPTSIHINFIPIILGVKFLGPIVISTRDPKGKRIRNPRLSTVDPVNPTLNSKTFLIKNLGQPFKIPSSSQLTGPPMSPCQGSKILTILELNLAL